MKNTLTLAYFLCLLAPLTGQVDLTPTNSIFTSKVTINNMFENNGLLYPLTDGLNGQVLTTDGTGNLSWSNVAINTGTGMNSSALGYQNNAISANTSAFGFENTANGNDAVAFGFQNQAGSLSTAVGNSNTATNVSGAFGYLNQASNGSAAFGVANTTTGASSNAFGVGNNATKSVSNAFGAVNEASGIRSSAFGYSNIASGDSSVAMGHNNDATMKFSSAIGYSNIASGLQSVALGWMNTATELNSTAVGSSNAANGQNSSAIGFINEASGIASSSIGHVNVASGAGSNAFGNQNVASGASSTALGFDNFAYAEKSTAVGYQTRSNVFGMTAIGINNLDPSGSTTTWVETDPVFAIGNGEDSSNRSTALTILKNGKMGFGTVSPDAQVEIDYNSSAGDPHLMLSESEANGFSRLTFQNSNNGVGFWTVAAKATGSINNPRFNIFYDDGTTGRDYLSVDPVNDNFIVRSDVIPTFNTFDLGNILDGIDDSEAWDDVVANEYLAPSDRRLKQNIQSLEAILPKLLKLNPVSYQYLPKVNPDGHNRTGFIAQEVLEIFPDVVVNEDVDVSDDGKVIRKKSEYYAMNYIDLIPITIKALQEQQTIIDEVRTENDELRRTNESQQEKINDLEKRLAQIEALLGKLAINNSTINNSSDYRPSTSTTILTDAKLEQNQQNPFTENTLIRYYIPNSIKQAVLRITNVEGKVLKDIAITNRGAGQTQLKAESLSAGSYFYTLILDGKPLETKQMVLTKN